MQSSISISPDPESQHRWSLRVGGGFSDESVQAFTSLFRQFAILGGEGAFVSRDSNGSNCLMHIVQERVTERDSIELLVDVRHCDIRYGRPLRNVVFTMGEVLEKSVLEFCIEPATRNARQQALKAEVDATEVSAGVFYPQFSPQLGVHVQKVVPPNYRSGRRLWFRLADKLSLKLLEDLIDLSNRWGSVLDAGFPGSEEELRSGESVILGVTGCQHDDETFEVLIDRFIASEAAFYSLMNLLAVRANRHDRVTTAVLE